MGNLRYDINALEILSSVEKIKEWGRKGTYLYRSFSGVIFCGCVELSLEHWNCNPPDVGEMWWYYPAVQTPSQNLSGVSFDWDVVLRCFCLNSLYYSPRKTLKVTCTSMVRESDFLMAVALEDRTAILHFPWPDPFQEFGRSRRDRYRSAKFHVTATSLHAVSSMLLVRVKTGGPYRETKSQPYEHCHNFHLRGVSDTKELGM
jgi:hypothetical protein